MYECYVMRSKFEKNNKTMSKILRVIEPFFVLNVDDTLTLSADGKYYETERNEEFHSNSDDSDMSSTFKGSFTISTKWAKQLIEDGFLEEVNPKKSDSFVNVFDEIDEMLERYKSQLANVPMEMAEDPECLRVEKTTVLKNIIKVLEHLKSLRK